MMNSDERRASRYNQCVAIVHEYMYPRVTYFTYVKLGRLLIFLASLRNYYRLSSSYTRGMKLAMRGFMLSGVLCCARVYLLDYIPKETL